MDLDPNVNLPLGACPSCGALSTPQIILDVGLDWELSRLVNFATLHVDF